MYLREHQGKEILRAAGFPVPASQVVSSPEEAAEAAKSIGPCVVKAQVRAGGRGKAGLIALAQTPAEASAAAARMLGQTHQGEAVDRLLVEARLDIAQELYLGVVLDTTQASPMALLSTKGGVDIEQVAAQHPHDLYRVTLDPLQEGISDLAPWLSLWDKAGLAPDLLERAAELTVKLAELFFQAEAFTLEINPLVVTRQGDIVAGDCKLIVDDAAVFRHPELQGFMEVDESSLEARANKVGVTYVSLDQSGTIGVMAGGAGICMTTMDEVADSGGVPVAFIDLGGGISEDNMTAALEIMLSTPGITGLCINVFGGINNCEIMARGVRRVWPQLCEQVTMVIKMRGHSQEEGWAILQELGVPVVKHGTTTEAVKLLMDHLRAAGR
ncbi:MAG: acetate--CoA ligase family protein [Desulfarculaceae bacterium]|nr:acetate--CoA ligase family protein [Desulfarculaceae bacterium]MCF8046755.1 acetate--CoA ligase family protein [Desulfarculaceae bacterium]MCF8124533.1 acetate--CoA ligase family protein [Desulfarculaceae bacterium]